MYNTQIIPTRFFGLDRFMDAFNGDNANLPRAAVVEKDGVYTLEIDIPGVKKENIDVHVEGDSLSIKAVRKTETSQASYERTFKLAKDLDPSTAEAAFEDGVLSFRLSKKPAEEKRKIAIK